MFCENGTICFAVYNSLRNTRDVVLQVSEKVIIYLKQMFLAICQKKEIPDNV